MENILLKKSFHAKNFKLLKFNSLWGYKGIFTTIRLFGKEPNFILVDQHLKKLNKDLRYFGIDIKISKNLLTNFLNKYSKIKNYDHLLKKKINLQKEEILFYFNNKILDGSTTNLIFVHGNKLFIPKNYYYYGITLEYLIKNLPYKIYRTDINISSLHQFSEILLVGSGKGVVSISFIKQFNWYRSSMKIYNFLSKKYSKILLK